MKVSIRVRVASFVALVAILTMAFSPLAFAKGSGGAEGGKWTNRPEGQPGWSEPAPGPQNPE
ncbi:MAG TPA: hypothetical protein VLQ52_04815 [Coriobacteriia bacterium]|nr:hypothetical protein [Coriobacteriia bacterium]